jgi:transposase InsO family protein
MVHRNARLAPAGRLILVQRVLSGRPVSHVAKELGVSRQCAHRWVSRYRASGRAGLLDRSSRPRSCPSATPVAVADEVLRLRVLHRWGPDELAHHVGISASTVSRLIARAGLPRLFDLDPVTGTVIRASRRTTNRYEFDRPGDLIHVDVKKRQTRIGFDYVHVAVDDHSRLAFAEILPDEKGPTCAAFLSHAIHFFAQHGFTIRRVMTDNALAYRNSRDFQSVIASIHATHVFSRPHCPWQNGKAERFNRTLQEQWAYRHPFTSNQARHAALAPWLDHYNYARAHTACGGHPPISRVTPTS